MSPLTAYYPTSPSLVTPSDVLDFMSVYALDHAFSSNEKALQQYNKYMPKTVLLVRTRKFFTDIRTGAHPKLTLLLLCIIVLYPQFRNKESRGGCGAQQPNITIDGIKMIAEYKAPKKKSDDQVQLPEPVERKQVLSAERVTIP
ncbi:DNA-directed RNA polymerase II subunit RPB1 [Platanthera zijinensis]|uniref:DNA-directed RNA polymerase II subunit RPB1 n=1 Tax=Platanthera zijinensis TaxID=2320716 RepID=A0AAP0BKJ2_9ASPA